MPLSKTKSTISSFANRFETSFNTTAASLVPLQRAFRFKTPYDIAEVGAVAVNARVTGDFEKLDVDLKSTVGSSKADIKGQVRSATLKQLPEIGSADLEIIASNPSLASLIEQFDLPINKPNASDDRSVGMTTTLKATEQLADIDGSFNVAGGTIMLKGRTNLSENEISTFDMTVDVNGPNVREFIRGLGVDFRPSNTDLGALSLTLAASGNMNDVSLKNIVGTAGPTKFTGAGELKDFNAEPDQGLKSAFDFTLVLDDVPVAGFTTDINTYDVDFTNTSTNATSYSWNFGDGNTSSETNPSHTYLNDGMYDVVLTATNNCGSVNFTQTVNIANTPTANWTSGPSEGCTPFTVQFQNQSSNNSTSWEWTFDGGTPSTSTEQNPIVV